jgi:zinc transporter, ZIP family
MTASAGEEEEGFAVNGKNLSASRDSLHANQLTQSGNTLSTGASQNKSWPKLISSPIPSCDGVACHGYGQPCGDCFRSVQARSENGLLPSRPYMRKSLSTPGRSTITNERTPLLPAHAIPSSPPTPPPPGTPLYDSTHHHHVPTNVFLSLGMQTATAIALHKIPEGFITYATNHANPHLGVAVFLSLFVHNITEGFALALPLYLALHSRSRALLWAALIGGVSQPFGAAIAALWFRVAGRVDLAPGAAVYGAMFAVIAGILTSVSLQLFNQAVLLTHSGGLCMIFAFVGMGIIGVSSALTA